MTSSMEKCFLLICLLLLATSSIVRSQFNTGATTSECESLQPAGVTPATGTVPFVVVVIEGSYTPGDPAIPVFIAGNDFVATGLILQARRTSNNADNTAFGSFNVPSDGNYRSLECGTSATDTITNTNTNPKPLSLSFMWNPPAENVGSIEFIVSLVDSNGNFWSNVPSTAALRSTEGELDPLSIATCPVPFVNSNVGTWTAPNCLRDGVQVNSATCVPPSGTTFPVGRSTVICTCSDRAETAECMITIDIVDGPNNPPDTPNCPGDQPAIALPGSDSVSVDYGVVQCNDMEDGVVLANCIPSSTFPFSIGATAVFCSCTDSGGLLSSCSFTVTVIGRTPCNPNPCQNGGTCIEVPVLPSGFFCQCPGGITTPTCDGPNNPPNDPNCPENQRAAAPAGSTSVLVDYGAVQCNDMEDGNFPANCVPSSPALFGIGDTEVVCTCRDSGGLLSACSFTVTVSPDRENTCSPNPCSAGNECRLSTSSLAGYTCHSVVGTPCL